MSDEDFIISDHAAIEMTRRKIPLEDIRSIVKQPQQTISVRPGRSIYQSIVNMDSKQYLLRLIVDEENPPILVTVYRTSKIQKYWKQS